MVQDELRELVKLFQKQGKMNFLAGTTEEKLTYFEKENSIILPQKYKKWLLFSDGGELFLPAGVQFYGVEHKPILNVNDDTRPNDEYVVIGTLASGDPILFKKNSEEIAIFNLEGGRIEDDEKYPDFIAFLKDLDGILGIGE